MYNEEKELLTEQNSDLKSTYALVTGGHSNYGVCMSDNDLWRERHNAQPMTVTRGGPRCDYD